MNKFLEWYKNIYSNPTEENNFGVSRRDVLTGGMIAAGTAMLLGSTAKKAKAQSAKTLQIDLVINLDTVLFVPEPADPNSNPPDGSVFIVRGTLFKGGSTTATTPPTETANRLGSWFCHGWIIKSPGLVTTQTYLFDSGETITTQGIEGPRARVITGGTGSFSGSKGETIPFLIGKNPTGGDSIRVTFNFKKK